MFSSLIKAIKEEAGSSGAQQYNEEEAEALLIVLEEAIDIDGAWHQRRRSIIGEASSVLRWWKVCTAVYNVLYSKIGL
jgi:hypothetical protein